MAPVDPHSYTDGAHPVSAHAALAFYLDFSASAIHASALVTLSAPHSGDLLLDTRALAVHSASTTTDAADPIPFALAADADADPVLGSALTLTLPADTSSFLLTFSTSPDASALQWLSPPQTASGLPFVFSQCQSIHARSIFPCHDTPAARITYSLLLNIPTRLSAVAAARHVARRDPVSSDHRGACDDALWCAPGRIVEEFEMAQCVPPYLFAFAAGAIGSRDLGPRTRVYAEDGDMLLDDAAREFAGVEDMVKVGESLFGPYEWERFDLLVLPPSFPYGGMENPRMVFLTPTVIKGDAAGAQVVAHELAHSWTGNLITNKTNEDLWLNEGFTTYAERRIVEVVQGEDRADLNMGIGWRGLNRMMERFKDNMEFTKLKPKMAGIDPDDVYSEVPYEKGFQFLWCIERQIGRPAFDEFLKKYIATFKFQSIDTETFLEFLKANVPGIENQVDLDVWIEGTGIPPDAMEPDSAIYRKICTLAAEFKSGKIPSEDEVADWSGQEWELYLENLSTDVEASQVIALDERYKLSESRDYEVKVAFLQLAVPTGCRCYFNEVEKCLKQVGRMKYLRPLYSSLAKCSEEKMLVKRIFSEAHEFFDPPLPVDTSRSMTTPQTAIQNGAVILSADKKQDEDEAGDHIFQIGPTDHCADEKEEKEHEDQDPAVLPTAQASIQAGGPGLFPEKQEHDDNMQMQADTTGLYAKPKEGNEGKMKKKEKRKQKQKEAADEEKQKKGQRASVKRLVETVRTEYEGFVDDEDKDSLEAILDSSNEVDADNWDDATNTQFLKRIELVRIIVKERRDNHNMKKKLIAELQTTLNKEAQSRHDEAKHVAKLVSEFRENVSRLEEQQRLIPTKQIKRKMEMGLLVLKSLEPMVQNLPFVCRNYNELVVNLNKWNTELISNTFWDRSPSKKNGTKLGSPPLLDYDNVKIEWFYFHPERTSFDNFIGGLRDRACDHPQYGKLKSKEGLECRLLEFQTAGKQPPRWFIIVLKYLQAEAELHMRSDNLYISGFRNKKKQLYELANGNNVPLLKGSVPFGCNCDYTSLMNYERAPSKSKDEDVKRLKELALNLWEVAGDIINLSEYDHTEQQNTKPDKWKEIREQVQKAIARFAVVFSEVCRFLVLFGLVYGGWRSNLGVFLSDLLIMYMRHWKVMSDRLRNDEEGSKFTDEEAKDIKMTYAFEAFKVLCLALNAKGDGIKKGDGPKGDGPKGDGPKGDGPKGDGPKGPKGDGPKPPAPPGPTEPSDSQGAADGNDKKPPHEVGGKSTVSSFLSLQGLESCSSAVQGTSSEDSSTCFSTDGNDKKPPHEDGGKSTVSSFLSLQGLQSCSSAVQGTSSEDSSTCFSTMKSVINNLLWYHNLEAINDGLLARASSGIKSELYGQPLVEVFSVHTNSAFIKSISIFDDRSGKVVYKSMDVYAVKFFQQRDLWLSSHTALDSSDYMEELLITGPDRAMTAFPGFILQADVDDGNGVFDVSWSWKDRTVVDKPMTQSIFTSRGDVHVTSVVMSNAVQVSVEMLLFLLPVYRRPANRRPAKLLKAVIGRLELQIDNWDVRCLMFQSDEKHPPDVKYVETTEEERGTGVVCKVPLTRSVFALPVDGAFRVKGDLLLDRDNVCIDGPLVLRPRPGLFKWQVSYKRRRTLNDLVVSHVGMRVDVTRPF